MTRPSFVLELGILVAIWLAGWGVAFWLIRKGINYIDHYVVTSIVFLSFSAVVIAESWRRFEPLTSSPILLPFVVLVVVVVTATGLYAVCPRYYRRPDGLIARHPEEFYLQLDRRYLVAKSFEVLFQQSVILALTLLLAATGLTMTAVVLTFLGLFGVLHLPMLRLVGRGPGLYYALAATTGAVVFPVLILRVHYGFVYSFAAHWFVYVLAGVLAWRYEGRAPQSRVGSPA